MDYTLSVFKNEGNIKGIQNNLKMLKEMILLKRLELKIQIHLNHF